MAQGEFTKEEAAETRKVFIRQRTQLSDSCANAAI